MKPDGSPARTTPAIAIDLPAAAAMNGARDALPGGRGVRR